MSIIGIVQVGSAAAEAGPVFLLEILIVVNSFLGLINLVPLPPLDGGHAAIATYEAIRGKIRGRAYRIDMAKLMPVVYAAMAFLLLFGLSAMYLDLAKPVNLGG
jgi:membrane-associated protease RseP (regulator of RpoE activity)